MRIEHEIVTVRTLHPFIIARGGSSEWRTVWVRIIDNDGAVGWGEAAPSRFYGETADTVVAVLGRFAPLLERSEERRVGKECRSRWSREYEKKHRWSSL